MIQEWQQGRCFKDKVALFTGIILTIFTGIFVLTELYGGEGNGKMQTEVKVLTAKEVKELIEKNDDDIFILDVRTRKEYDAGHIRGANLVPIQELEDNIHKIPKDKIVIVHCAKGGRSTKAVNMLRDKGLKELYNFKGGFVQWQSEGYPVEK